MANVISKPFNSNLLKRGQVRNISAGRLDRVAHYYDRETGKTDAYEPSGGFTFIGKGRAEVLNYKNPVEGVGDFPDVSETDLTIRVRWRSYRDDIEALRLDGRDYEVLDWIEDLAGPRRRYMLLFCESAPHLDLASYG